MNIDHNDIEKINQTLQTEVVEKSEYYSFIIHKFDHSFEVQLLKNGQYIFTTLYSNNKKYEIEHIEFYMNESKNEVLKELFEQIQQLKNLDSRIVNKKKWFRNKIQVELLKQNRWEEYGYLSKLRN